MPAYNLVPWLRSDGIGKKRNSVLSMIAHDIYVIGTQESSVSEKDWISKFRTLLLENFGEEFALVITSFLCCDFLYESNSICVFCQFFYVDNIMILCYLIALCCINL